MIRLFLIFSILIFCICIIGCDYVAYPTGGHAIVIKNETWFVSQKNDGIDVFVTGRFSNGDAMVKAHLNYLEQVSLYVLVNESYTIAYIIPNKKEAGLVGDAAQYTLIYCERLSVYPEDGTIYIDSPIELSMFDWVHDPVERKEIKEQYYGRVN